MPIKTTPRRIIAVALTLLLAAALAACGSEASNPSAAPSPSFPLTVTAANGDVVIAERPDRIVSLSPTATEMLFAIGAGQQVVAVDDQSTFPPSAPKTALSGFTPNAEAIAGYQPDLVVISNDLNGLVASLGRLNIPVLLEPAAKNLDEVYAQIRQLGSATGNAAKADEVATEMKSTIDGLVSSHKKPSVPVSVYHEIDPSLYTVTSKTFAGQIYSLFGLVNVADAADKDGSGYPQLSAEYLVQSDPDVIFLADTKCCGQSAQTLAQRPGFGSITAVRTGNVVPLDDDIASRWGPRVVDFVRAVSEGTAKAKAAA